MIIIWQWKLLFFEEILFELRIDPNFRYFTDRYILLYEKKKNWIRIEMFETKQ